jgi:hypothetical protein
MPSAITEEQQALTLAWREPPKKYGYPHTHWSDRLLAEAVVKQGIVESISHNWIWLFFDYFVFWGTIFENAIENDGVSCPSQINPHWATE